MWSAAQSVFPICLPMDHDLGHPRVPLKVTVNAASTGWNVRERVYTVYRPLWDSVS